MISVLPEFHTRYEDAHLFPDCSGMMSRLLLVSGKFGQITVQRALAELVDSGEVLKIGGGRYTKYAWNRENEK